MASSNMQLWRRAIEFALLFDERKRGKCLRRTRLVMSLISEGRSEAVITEWEGGVVELYMSKFNTSHQFDTAGEAFEHARRWGYRYVAQEQGVAV